MKLFFSPNTNSLFHKNIASFDIFFLLEKNNWIFTSNLDEADVIPCSLLVFTDSPNILNHIKKNQLLLVWHIESCADHVSPEYCRNLVKNSTTYEAHKQILFVHTNALDTADPQYIHHDIMFNRHKFFCADYDTSDWVRGKSWIGDAPKYTYSLSEIRKQEFATNKLFYAPIRVVPHKTSDSYNPFNHIKERLVNYLKNINVDMYLSDPYNNMYFEPNGWKNNTEVQHFNTKQGGFWWPAADFYYQTSYISVGIESVFRNSEIFYPCEKTFDPLIKGNFPLIFSTANSVERLGNYYGFKFPDWIDYSYDQIDDTEERFEAYLKSIQKVAEIPLHKIHELSLRDKHILDHNKDIFFNRSYDFLYPKVKKSMQHLGWK